jgi:hypothetical protein
MADTLKQAMLNKARQDKFILSFSVPECLKLITTSEERATHHKSHLRVMPDSLQYSVYGAVVPSVNVPSTDVAQWGHTLKVSTHERPPYDDVEVNFTIDNQFNNYWYIWKWLDIMNDAEESGYDANNIGTAESIADYINRGDIKDPNLMRDYQTNFTLKGLNEYDKEAVSFTYTNAFPIGLSEITYNHRESDEIQSAFTFSFFQLHVNLL